MTFDIVVAVSNNNGIGFNGKIPWKSKEDMKFFKNLTCSTRDPTKTNAIIMGRITFESLNENPLKDRDNFVISRTIYKNVKSFTSLNECLENIGKDYETVFVIGGTTLYCEAVNHPLCDKIYLNTINTSCECDKFFTYDESKFKKLSEVSICHNVHSTLLKRII